MILGALFFLINSIYFLLFYKRIRSYKYLTGKTAVVTGGNSGIGYHTALVFASRGCKVILADCDNGENSVKKIIQLTGNPNISYKHLDLSSLKNVRDFADQIKKEEQKVDFLLNIAGIIVPYCKQSDVTVDGLNCVTQVNYFGAFLLTHLMIDVLKKAQSSRVIFVGSMSISFQKLTSDFLKKPHHEMNPMAVYGTSKFCNVFAGREFGRRLQKYNITVNTFDPLVSKTPLFEKTYRSRNPWMMKYISNFTVFFTGKDPSDIADDLFYVATSEEIKDNNGGYYTRNTLRTTPTLLQDKAFCQEIWNTTEELVELKYNEKIL